MQTEQPSAGPSADALQFDTAEPSVPQFASLSCAVCSQPLRDSYHEVNGKTVCAGCRAGLEAARGSFPRAILLGAGAGFAGWAIYFAILKITSFELALIAILVGYMVGKAVNAASGGRGGRAYQILAVVITWVACTSAYLPLLAAEMNSAEASGAAVWIVAEGLALVLPFLSITQSPIGLVILGVGVWQAWTLNRRVTLQFSGPHAVAVPAEPAEPALA